MIYHVLNHGTATAQSFFAQQSEFVRGYVEAMFFTDANPDNAELRDATVNDMSNDLWASVIEDCEEFQNKNKKLLDVAYRSNYSMEQAGVDFWLTRNRHGAGYWDREELGAVVGTALSEATHEFGEVTLFRGDDSKIYAE